jgi:hypothetical protein
MVVYCIEFIQRRDGLFDSQQYFGQHFDEEELSTDTEPSAPYEIYQVTGHSVFLPKNVLSEAEKKLWLHELQGMVGPDGTSYRWRRAV